MHDYNGQPFSSLEPEILCRLVYVRSVECLSGSSTGLDLATEPQQAPPAGGGAGAGGSGSASGSGGGAAGDGGGQQQQQQQQEGTSSSKAAAGEPASAAVAAAAGAAEAATAAAAPPLAAARGISALEPLMGHTELPTCPVCLERLDEHISGVVTTVSPASVLPGILGLVQMESVQPDTCEPSNPSTHTRPPPSPDPTPPLTT